MGFIRGVKLNIQGLWLGLRTPKLLVLGLLRFVMMLLIFLGAAAFFIAYHDAILLAIWAKPESAWLIWLWHLVSWIISLVLLGVATVVGYFIAQILFSVVIMDTMSRLTEKVAAGRELPPPEMPFFRHLFYLVRRKYQGPFCPSCWCFL